SIIRRFYFRLEGSENTVPENKYSCIILVQVLWIGSMMHPVMRRCIENKFKPAGHFINRFGMYPVLEQCYKPAHGRNNFRRNTHNGQRQKHPERKYAMKPALAESYGQVIFLALVMHNMCPPHYI